MYYFLAVVAPAVAIKVEVVVVEVGIIVAVIIIFSAILYFHSFRATAFNYIHILFCTEQTLPIKQHFIKNVANESRALSLEVRVNYSLGARTS